MTFEEAKRRNDYSFKLNGIQNQISRIRANSMDNMFDNGDPDRGCAVLEIGYVDIEVNIFTKEQLGDQTGGNAPVIFYFVCLKDETEWRSDDYVDWDIQVDWKDPNWDELLEKDMFAALDKYVTDKGYSYDKAN